MWFTRIEIKKLFPSSSGVLVSRRLGKDARHQILRYILTKRITGGIELSFDGIDICDVTFLDELFFKLQFVLRHRDINASAYFADITPEIGDNLHAATLLRKSHRRFAFPVLIRMPGDFFKTYAYGDITHNIFEAYTFVQWLGEATARKMADMEDHLLADASTRLRKAYQLGLLLREQQHGTHGSPIIYKPVVNLADHPYRHYPD